MPKYDAGAVSTSAIETLLSDLGHAKALGQLTWSRLRPQTRQAVIDVRTEVMDCETGMLRMYVADARPDRIHVQYLINRVPVRRLDTNETHRGFPPDMTHKHTYVPNGAESAYIPDDIPAVPLGPTVAPGTYRAVFEAFASECFIELPEGYWTEPGR
ncbi:hypothetical protein HFP15_41740 [Amycolatopsis sp. K13G38]|uniref:Uncharacterized protein n=1 Tax=Amycolatopsis acididurans TaxID=2724524 RepID=A0ABX1JM86_9PSEU|nr:hypothetical protein [Amycolatopsis acididurans]NKQ59377.1 hypothetical protein [Amycolatopsis acididurans]